MAKAFFRNDNIYNLAIPGFEHPGIMVKPGKYVSGNYYLDAYESYGLTYVGDDVTVDPIEDLVYDYVEVLTGADIEPAVPNGLATLDATGKLDLDQLPNLAISSTSVVADQAARLALTAEIGDIAIQTDNGLTYILAASPATDNANWKVIAATDLNGSGTANEIPYWINSTTLGTTGIKNVSGHLSWNEDVGVDRSDAGVLKVTNGSTGYGSLAAHALTVRDTSSNIWLDLGTTSNSFYIAGTTAGVAQNAIRFAASYAHFGLGGTGILGWTPNYGGGYIEDFDVGLARSAAGVVKVTDGSTGYGAIDALKCSFTDTAAVTNYITVSPTGPGALMALSRWNSGGNFGFVTHNGGVFQTASGGAFKFSATAIGTGTPDLSLSRISAGVLGVGTGAAGSAAGKISLNAEYVWGTLLGNDGVFFGRGSVLAWTASNPSGGAASADLYLTRRATATLQHGGGDSATPVAQTIATQGSRGGTDVDIAGANLTIQSGLGTGAATPSVLKFALPQTTTTGSTQQTARTMVSIGENASYPFRVYGAAGTGSINLGVGYPGLGGNSGYLLWDARNDVYKYSFTVDASTCAPIEAKSIILTGSFDSPSSSVIRGNSNVIQFGPADAATPSAQMLTFQHSRGGTDTNVAGADATIQGSLGTGSAASGKLVFKVGTPNASGSTQHTANTVLTLQDTGTGGTPSPTAIVGGNLQLGATDLSLSRISAGVVGVGTGAAGSTAGTIQAILNGTGFSKVEFSDNTASAPFLSIKNTNTTGSSSAAGYSIQAENGAVHGSVAAFGSGFATFGSAVWLRTITNHPIKLGTNNPNNPQLQLDPASGTLVTSLGIGATASSITGDVWLTRRAAATLQLGAADSATPVAQTIAFQGATGENIAGQDATIQGSLGTGTGASGKLVFKVGTPTTTGTTQHTANTVLTLQDTGTGGTPAGAAIVTGKLGIGRTPLYALDVYGAGAGFTVYNTTNGGSGSFYLNSNTTGGVAKYITFSHIADDAALYLIPDSTTKTGASLVVKASGVNAKVVVTPNTGTATPASTDSRTVYTNTGDTDGSTINLPTAAAGLEYTVVVTDAQTITVNASSGDYIRLGSNLSSSGGNVSSNTVGSVVRLVAVDDTTWVAVSIIGTWATA